MPHLVAAITDQEDIFVVFFSTTLTRLFVIVVLDELKDGGGIEFGDLRTIFNLEGGDDAA